VVLSPQQPEAEQELLRIASERHSPLIQVEHAYAYQEDAHTLDGQEMTITRRPAPTSDLLPSLAAEPLHLHLPLLGFHQVQNAATALAALDVVAQTG